MFYSLVKYAMVAYDVCIGEDEGSTQERISGIGGEQQYMVLFKMCTGV